MPFSDIRKVTVRRKCCGTPTAVVITAKEDSTPHVISFLRDPDGFVALVEPYLTNDDLESAPGMVEDGQQMG